ncbi:MAG: hypothetical protein ACRD1V_08425 [Vicinamibacterales bacterium]
MNRGFRWAAPLLALIAMAVVGVLSYNAGIVHGIAMSPALANAPAAAAVRYGWYRPWGFGFFTPLFFLLVWFLVFGIFSRLWWGGFYGRRRWYAGGGCAGPEGFNDLHRRAHEEMNKPS